MVMEENRKLQEEINEQKEEKEELNIENQTQEQTEGQKDVSAEESADENQMKQDGEQVEESRLQQESENKKLSEQEEDSEEEKKETQDAEEQEIVNGEQEQGVDENSSEEKIDAPQEEVANEELQNEAESQKVQSVEQTLEENEEDKEKKEKRTKKKQPVFYEDFLLKKSWKQKRYRKLLWGGVEIDDVVQKLLSYIPENFHGRLLDVPAGTGVLTHEKYAQLKEAKIVCLEPREKEAVQLNELLGQDEACSHVKVINGKTERLPFRKERFDVVLCMNGFQAFPNKSRAFSEVTRVLRKRGRLIGCFYIKGQSKKADWFVKYVYAKKGWFAPPYDTLSSLRLKLAADYRIKSFHVRGSMVYFCAVKKDNLAIVHARDNHFAD